MAPEGTIFRWCGESPITACSCTAHASMLLGTCCSGDAHMCHYARTFQGYDWIDSLREIASVEITDSQLEQAKHRFPYAPHYLLLRLEFGSLLIPLRPCVVPYTSSIAQTFSSCDEGGLLLPTNFREPLSICHSSRMCPSICVNRVFHSEGN